MLLYIQGSQHAYEEFMMCETTGTIQRSIYIVNQKDGLNLYVYISWTIQGMWMIYITFEGGDP